MEWLQSQWLGTSLVITNRLSITVSYYIIELLNMELYPTCLRQTGMSLGNLASGGAAALAPYILHLVSLILLIFLIIFFSYFFLACFCPSSNFLTASFLCLEAG